MPILKMGPRKRPRQDETGANTAAASNNNNTPSPLQPSQATTTSQVSSLSAAPSTPASTSRRGSAIGMPPIPLQQSESSSSKKGSDEPGPQGNKVIQKTKSWYGSLSRKSTASLSIQKETIAGSPLKAGSTPDFHRYDLKRNGDTASLSGASQDTLTKLDETTGDAPNASTDIPSRDQNKTVDASDTSQNDQIARDTMTRNPTDPADTSLPDAPPAAETLQRPTTSSGWLGGWFSRAPAAPEKPAEVEDASKMTEEPPRPPESPQQEATAPTQPADEQPASPKEQRPANYWFNFWSNQSVPEDDKEVPAEVSESTPNTIKDSEDTTMEEAPPADPDPYSKPTAGSTWAFWSRDQPKSTGKQSQPQETGELAVVGDRSEHHPKRANSMDMSREAPAKQEPPKEQQSAVTKADSIRSTKKGKKPKPQPINVETISRPRTPQSDAASIVADSPSKSKGKAPGTATKPAPPNLLLPTFRGTYRMKENPSILKQITSLLLRTQQPPMKHVFLSQEPPKIKKALAIGVHGLFPAAYLRHLIGQPTGTSIKFANQCADGIRRWADSHGCHDCEIEKVALEGEGKIEQRVENLWSLLLNWTKQIREADLIVVACHSQGVPVSVMLLAKLIDSGIIRNAKIGVCAMAGVNLGPFPDYKGGMGMLMGSAAELWEFANSESEVSRKYEASLKDILAHGVRITYVGSIDDQLVPIESAIYSPASHPYIYRAIFIDGRIHAPDFIAHLVGFACKLRNLGVSDHGLIRELSVPLAGSLYGGEGHSRLYDDAQVYDLAISHCLETTQVGKIPCEIQKYEGLASSNPYHLPWIMRGLLEEDFVKTELSTETEELLRQFDDWKPATKALKDVKYRLEAVRSKL